MRFSMRNLKPAAAHDLQVELIGFSVRKSSAFLPFTHSFQTVSLPSTRCKVTVIAKHVADINLLSIDV